MKNKNLPLFVELSHLTRFRLPGVIPWFLLENNLYENNYLL